MKILTTAMGVLLSLTACGGTPAPRTAADAAPAQDAMATVGDLTMRATVVPTSTLDASIARGYGIERSDRSALVLVSVQRGNAAGGSSEPAGVTVRASDLRGNAVPVAMRELRAGGELSYVGTVAVDPPDTLRFDIAIQRADGGSSTLQVTREFHPR